jgi:hypothetical protein
VPDHPANVFRDRDLCEAGAPLDFPVAVALDQDGVPHEVVSHVDDEQWIAPGALIDHPGQFGERAVRGEAAGQVLANRRLVQPRERDVAAVSVYLQLVLDRRERMPLRQRLGPVRAEH